MIDPNSYWPEPLPIWHPTADAATVVPDADKPEPVWPKPPVTVLPPDLEIRLAALRIASVHCAGTPAPKLAGAILAAAIDLYAFMVAPRPEA